MLGQGRFGRGQSKNEVAVVGRQAAVGEYHGAAVVPGKAVDLKVTQGRLQRVVVSPYPETLGGLPLAAKIFDQLGASLAGILPHHRKLTIRAAVDHGAGCGGALSHGDGGIFQNMGPIPGDQVGATSVGGNGTHLLPWHYSIGTAGVWVQESWGYWRGLGSIGGAGIGTGGPRG
jgi:hypothetical protein